MGKAHPEPLLWKRKIEKILSFQRVNVTGLGEDPEALEIKQQCDGRREGERELERESRLGSMVTLRGPGWYRGLEHSWEVNDYGTTGQNMVSSPKPSPACTECPSFSAWPLHLPHCLSLPTPHFILEPPESLRQSFLRVGLIGLDFRVSVPANGLGPRWVFG